MTEDEKTQYDISQFLDFDYIREKVLTNLDEIVKVDIQTGFGGKILRKIEIIRRDVFNAATNGSNVAVISHIFGIDRKTLLKHFKKEVEYAHGLAKWKLQNKLFIEAMTSANSAERIFLAKNWLGMTDNGMYEEMISEDEGVEFKVKRPERKAVPAVVEVEEDENT